MDSGIRDLKDAPGRHNDEMDDRDQTWREFEAMAKRSLKQRITYGFVSTYKPILDDVPYRSFESMKAYRDWCDANLPGWLGFASV